MKVIDNTLRLPDELIVHITFYFTHVDMAHFRNTSHASEDLNLSRSLAMIPIRIPPDKRADLVFVLNLIRCRNDLLWKMNKKEFSKPLSIEEIKSPTINIPMPPPIPSLADATALMVNGTLSSEITIPTISIPLPRPIPIADLIDHKFISSLMESKKNNNNKTDRDNTLRLPDELIVLITFYFTHVDMAHFRNTSHASEDLNLSRSLAMIPIRIPPDKRADLVFVLNLIRCRNNLLWKMNKKKFSKPLSIEIKSPTINISMPRPIPIANLIDHKFISSLMESKKNKNKTDSKKSYCLVM